MSSIYEIDQRIIDLIDPETGEITDPAALDALAMERTEKLDNLCCWWKDLTGDAKKIHAEITALQEREAKLKKRAESLCGYIARVLDGEPLTTARNNVKWRATSRVQLDPGFMDWAMENGDCLLTYKDPEPNKTAIREALKQGAVPFAHIEKSRSMSIK